jgi:ABC-type nickel/cobalt efflux system permease component RcnA
VLFVGAAGVVLRAFVDVEALSRWAEFVIGFVLIGVGIWAISQMRHVVLHKHPHRHEIDNDSPVADDARHAKIDDVTTRADDARHANIPAHNSHTDSHFVAPHESHLHVSSPMTRQVNIHAHLHVHANGACSDTKRMQKDPGRGSFFVGLIHGAAGTGHLLGVVPTLSLPPILGAMYLGAYGVAAVVAMGAFGLTMGTIGNRLAPALLRRFMLGCGIVAIGLGLYWLQSGWRDIHGHHQVNNSRTVQDVG